MAVFYGRADAGWAACLTLDLRARGVVVWDHADAGRDRAAIAGEAGALLVVRSWLGPPALPTAAEVAAVSGRGGDYVVVRRNWTKLAMGDRPDGAVVLALWDDYYQPSRSPGGRGSGGIANLLDIFLGASARLDLPDGYVFISYRQRHDRLFVQNQLRPCLSAAGITSWDYRMSERVPDKETGERLEQLVTAASALLVVATTRWHSPWTDLELEVARRQRRPVLGVRPPTTRGAPAVMLGGGRTYVLAPGGKGGERVVAALRAEGVRAFGEG